MAVAPPSTQRCSEGVPSRSIGPRLSFPAGSPAHVDSAWIRCLKDHPWRRETIKSTLMVMYSSVSTYCHPQMLLAHVDNPITAKIIHHYSSSCQDISLKMAFMKSIVQVTSAIRNIKDLEDFRFAPKQTLTGLVVVS